MRPLLLLLAAFLYSIACTSPVQAVPVSASTAGHPVRIHIVQRGETLYSLAHGYGVPIDLLRAANHLRLHTAIHPGQRLVIPGSGPAVPAPLPPPKIPVQTLQPTAPHYLFITGRIKQEIDAPHVTPGRWRYIVFHHSGTPSGNAKIFDYFHRNVRGMENGLAYHFVIGNGHGSGDGEIEIGGRWTKQLQGGHLHSDALNQIAIGVCFVGDFDKTQPSKKQIAAAIELFEYLRRLCGTPSPIFKAHREINPRPTECPGKLFPVAAFHKLFD